MYKHLRNRRFSTGTTYAHYESPLRVSPIRGHGSNARAPDEEGFSEDTRYVYSDKPIPFYSDKPITYGATEPIRRMTFNSQGRPIVTSIHRDWSQRRHFDDKLHHDEVNAIADYLSPYERDRFQMTSFPIFMAMSTVRVVQLTKDLHNTSANAFDKDAHRHAISNSPVPIEWIPHRHQHPSFGRGQVYSRYIPYLSLYLRALQAAEANANNRSVMEEGIPVEMVVSSKLIPIETVCAESSSPISRREEQNSQYNGSLKKHKMRRLSVKHGKGRIDRMLVNRTCLDLSPDKMEPRKRRTSISGTPRSPFQLYEYADLNVEMAPFSTGSLLPMSIDLYTLLLLKGHTYQIYLKDNVPRYELKAVDCPYSHETGCRCPPYEIKVCESMPRIMHQDKTLQIFLKLLSLFPTGSQSVIYDSIAERGLSLPIHDFLVNTSHSKFSNGTLFANCSIVTNLSTLCQVINGWGCDQIDLQHFLKTIYEFRVEIKPGDSLHSHLNKSHWLHAPGPSPPLSCDSVLTKLQALKFTGSIPDGFMLPSWPGSSKPSLKMLSLVHKPTGIDENHDRLFVTHGYHVSYRNQSPSLAPFSLPWCQSLMVLSLTNVLPPGILPLKEELKTRRKELYSKEGISISTDEHSVVSFSAPMMALPCSLRFLALNNIRIPTIYSRKSTTALEHLLGQISPDFPNLQTLSLSNLSLDEPEANMAPNLKLILPLVSSRECQTIHCLDYHGESEDDTCSSSGSVDTLCGPEWHECPNNRVHINSNVTVIRDRVFPHLVLSTAGHCCLTKNQI